MHTCFLCLDLTFVACDHACWVSLPADPTEAYLWLADRSGGSLPTTTRTGRFSAWNFAWKTGEEPVWLMEHSTKERSGAGAETFPCTSAWDHAATGSLCQPWGCQLHNIPCLPWGWARATQAPLGGTPGPAWAPVSHSPDGSFSPARCPRP